MRYFVLILLVFLGCSKGNDTTNNTPDSGPKIISLNHPAKKVFIGSMIEIVGENFWIEGNIIFNGKTTYTVEFRNSNFPTTLYSNLPKEPGKYEVSVEINKLGYKQKSNAVSIVVESLDKSPQIITIDSNSNNDVRLLGWSSDDKFVFVSSASFGSSYYSIYKIDVSSGQIKKLNNTIYSDVDILHYNSKNNVIVSIGPGNGNFGWKLSVYNAENGSLQYDYHLANFNVTGESISSGFYPNGEELVFTSYSYTTQDSIDVYITNISTRLTRKIGRIGKTYDFISFSPTGDKIAFLPKNIYLSGGGSSPISIYHSGNFNLLYTTKLDNGKNEESGFCWVNNGKGFCIFDGDFNGQYYLPSEEHLERLFFYNTSNYSVDKIMTTKYLGSDLLFSELNSNIVQIGDGCVLVRNNTNLNIEYEIHNSDNFETYRYHADRQNHYNHNNSKIATSSYQMKNQNLKLKNSFVIIYSL